MSAKKTHHWEPWLMKDGKRDVRLILGRDFKTSDDITQFFAHMHKTHPNLVGKHIEFEEVEDAAPRIVVPLTLPPSRA